MPSPAEHEVSIPSDTTIAQGVQEDIVAEMERRGYSMRDVFSVRLALEEAITNAIRHGNGNDPELTVQIVWSVADEKIRVSIEDQGSGFKMEDVPDCTEDEFLNRPSGRGVMLIRTYMTTVEYNDVGNRVTLEKVRDAPAED